MALVRESMSVSVFRQYRSASGTPPGVPPSATGCHFLGQTTDAAARPALRPEKMQPPKNVPSSAR